jgi:hypothetical protein
LSYKYKKLKLKDGTTQDEHRYIMEQFLGRKLESYEVVHHKDGNKRNNDLENLEVILLSEHSTLHLTNHIVTDETKEKQRKSHIGKYNYNVRKLSNEQVSEIRELASKGYTRRKLAEIYSVSKGTIDNIVNKIHYKDAI